MIIDYSYDAIVVYLLMNNVPRGEWQALAAEVLQLTNI